ncbi:hypothetical protein GCM10027615_67510 [Plantactinospora veratri]
MYVDGLILADRWLPPYLLQQFPAGHYPAGPRREIGQQVELLAGQRQRHPVEVCAPLADVDPQPADGVYGRLDRPARPADPAEHRGDPGVQVGAGERLHHVVVGTGPEQPDDRLLVVPGGGDDDRHVGDAAQHPQRVGAVQIGQPEVEYDQVGGFGGDPAQRVERRTDRVHRVPAVGQGAQHGAAYDMVVFDQEDGGHLMTVLPMASRVNRWLVRRSARNMPPARLRADRAPFSRCRRTARSG